MRTAGVDEAFAALDPEPDPFADLFDGLDAALDITKGNRAALVAAGRIAPLQPKLTNTWTAQAQEADRIAQGGFKPGELAPQAASRSWGRR